MGRRKEQKLDASDTELVKIEFADGKEYNGSLRMASNFLNEMMKASKPRKGSFKFCPTLDTDEEGYVKVYQFQFFPDNLIVQKWYSGKVCPRCKKAHEFPIRIKIRPGNTLEEEKEN